MPLVLITGPSTEPLTVDEARTFLRVDNTDEDLLLASLIASARIHIEQTLNPGLITQQWSLFLNAWPRGSIVDLPAGPVQSIIDILIYDELGIPAIWNSADYDLDRYSRPPRLIRKADAWPEPGSSVNGIDIRFTAGYGDDADDVPEPLRHAIRLLVAHWFENRQHIVPGETAVSVPDTVHSLLAPYRAARI